jgi:hypothetical protein
MLTSYNNSGVLAVLLQAHSTKLILSHYLENHKENVLDIKRKIHIYVNVSL